MNTVTTGELTPGISLTCVSSEKFKTGCFSVNLVTGLDRESASATALLPRVLRRGTEKLQDIEKIAAALDELYGSYSEPVIRKKGEMQCIGFFADFPDRRHLPGGVDTLKEVAAITRDLLLAPDTQGGCLRTDYTASEKTNLIDDIRASINDKRGYAIDRLIEEMCAGEVYAVQKLGSESEAEAITPQSLTQRYKDLIAGSAVKFFYCGSEEPSRVSAALGEAFSGLAPRPGATIPPTSVLLAPPVSPPRRFTESLDVTQGKLTVGFRLGAAMESPDYNTMTIFNAIYGGSVTSKLFLNVRERLSLCYYASSFIDKHKGIMLVSSGVEFANFDKALDEILAQLDNIKKGDVSEAELLAAKRIAVTGVKSAMDRPSGLEELYFDSSVSAVHYDPEKLCENIEAVTIDDVVEFASGIETDSIYCLRD
ncbi:MAG: insulinase family protein [Oscillospiraceae bacterium]|nr:insulinase family protein [Oscillospiraceae bacterium]